MNDYLGNFVAPHKNPFTDPAKLAAYDQSRMQRWSDIQHKTNGYESNGGGGFFDTLDSVMEPIMENVIKYGPAIYMAAAGGQALGLFGEGTAAAGGVGAGTGTAAGEVGLGAMSNAGLGLDSLGFLDSMAATGGGLGAGTAAGAGGLGSMVGVAGGAPAVVTISGAAPAATAGGMGLGGGAAATGGLGLGISNLDLASVDQAAGGVDPGMKPNSDLNNVNPVADGASNLPIGSGSTDWLKLAQQGGSLFDSLGGLIAGNRDRITNQQDQEYYENLMNKMMGMYQPGTPEATLMEQQMKAKDAAAGRNSQYGVRATNLAGQLAGQRAQIMTSPTFNSMAQASRGHYDNSLNSLFSAMGNGSGGIGGTIGQIGQIGNGISNILGLGKSLFG